MQPRVRLLALGGVVGPVTFVAAWAIAGATTEGYSSVDGAISDLAAVGASTCVVMTAAFVVFGFGLIAFGFALREVFEGTAWIAAVATGVCTLGVAATPLGGWSGDDLHAVFASLGYAAIASLPLLAAAPLMRSGRRYWARASVLTAGISAACLIATTFGANHGLWQRIGLTVGDVWVVGTASYLASRPTTTEHVSLDGSP